MFFVINGQSYYFGFGFSVWYLSVCSVSKGPQSFAVPFRVFLKAGKKVFFNCCLVLIFEPIRGGKMKPRSQNRIFVPLRDYFQNFRPASRGVSVIGL